MKITCISDLHGHYPKLDGGDLLIVAGDLTARASKDELLSFHVWVSGQNYKTTIIIAGNHDTTLQNEEYPFYNRGWACDGVELPYNRVVYLCDSGTEFEGLKIWGSPWTKTFPGMNPHCKAFTVDTEEELAEKWAMIPDDVDILVTHSPPHGLMDEVADYSTGKIINVGSTSLKEQYQRIRPKLHLFGHIHEGYGQWKNGLTKFFNASHVNEHYKPVNKPINIEI